MNPLRGNVVLAAAPMREPPPARRESSATKVQPAPPGAHPSKRAAKRARKPAAVAAAAPKVAAGSATSGAIKEVHAPAGMEQARAALTKETLDSVPDLRPALDSLLMSLSREALPRATAERKDARAMVDEFVTSSKPAAVASEITAVEAELACLKRARECWSALPEAQGAARVAEHDEQIAKLQQRLDSLSRKAPTPTGLACSLKASKAEFQKHVQSRKDAWDTGAASADTRSKERRVALDRILVQVGVVRAALDTEEARVRDAHRTRNELCRTEFEATLVEFDRRIGEAQPMVDVDAAATLAPPPAADTVTQLAELQQRMAEMAAQVTTTRTQLEQQTATSLVLQRVNASMQVVDGPPGVQDLPKLEPKDASLMAACGAMCQMLRKWKEMGHPPFAFEDAMSVCPEFPKTCRTALGSHARRWFADDASTATVVPKQVANLLLDAMLALQSKYEDPSSHASDAKRCSEWAEGLSKRVCA